MVTAQNYVTIVRAPRALFDANGLFKGNQKGLK